MSSDISQWIEYGFSPKEKPSSRSAYHGPCAASGAGDDRFVVWPDEGEYGRYYCRHECPDCQYKGDRISFLMHFGRVSFPKACELVGKEVQKQTNSWKDRKFPPATASLKNTRTIDKKKEVEITQPIAQAILPETETLKGKDRVTQTQRDELDDWLNGPSRVFKPEPISENHFCYLGQRYCTSHENINDIEKCKRHGVREIDSLNACPTDVEIKETLPVEIRETHPVNGWCYLGQEFCEYHTFYSRVNIEKCSYTTKKKHGELNLGLLSSCPLREEKE